MSKETPRCPVPYTTIPNTIIDEWMYLLSRPAMEALLVIVRDILGWEDRTEAIISFPSFLKRTHQNRTTLTLALQELCQVELIVISDRHGKHGANIYQLGPAIFSSPPTGLVVNHPKAQKKAKTSPPTGQDAVQPVDRMQSSERTGSSTVAGPDISRRPTQGKPPREAKETLKEIELKKGKEIQPQASPSAGAPIVAPSVKSLEEQADEIGAQHAFQNKVRQFYQWKGKKDQAEHTGTVDGEAQREYRRLKRELEEEYGFIPPLEQV